MGDLAAACCLSGLSVFVTSVDYEVKKSVKWNVFLVGGWLYYGGGRGEGQECVVGIIFVPFLLKSHGGNVIMSTKKDGRALSKREYGKCGVGGH